MVFCIAAVTDEELVIVATPSDTVVDVSEYPFQLLSELIFAHAVMEQMQDINIITVINKAVILFILFYSPFI